MKPAGKRKISQSLRYESRDNCSNRVTTLRETDVLLGRGSAIASFVGNLNYRQIIRAHKRMYAMAQREKKGEIAELILKKIAEQEPPGRFVERAGDRDGDYCIVSRQKALGKTSQALREKKDLPTKAFDFEKGATKPETKSVQKKKRKLKIKIKINKKRAESLQVHSNAEATTIPPLTTILPKIQDSDLDDGVMVDKVANSLYCCSSDPVGLNIAHNDDNSSLRTHETLHESNHPGDLDSMFSILPPHLTAFFSGIYSSRPSTGAHSAEQDNLEVSSKLIPSCQQGPVEEHGSDSPNTVMMDLDDAIILSDTVSNFHLEAVHLLRELDNSFGGDSLPASATEGFFFDDFPDAGRIFHESRLVRPVPYDSTSGFSYQSTVSETG